MKTHHQSVSPRTDPMRITLGREAVMVVMEGSAPPPYLMRVWVHDPEEVVLHRDDKHSKVVGRLVS